MKTLTELTWCLMLDDVADFLQMEEQQQRSGSQQHEEPQRPEEGAGPLHDHRHTDGLNPSRLTPDQPQRYHLSRDLIFIKNSYSDQVTRL